MVKFQIKKTFILFLVFILLSGMGTSFAESDYNDSTLYVNSDEYRFVKAFDLMPICNYDDFQPEKPLTRGEFARILCALGGILPTEGYSEFVDISTNEYKGYISAVNDFKIMVGADKYTFLPDKEISVNEVLKTVVFLLGYDVMAQAKGGYPIGYITVANELKISNGVNPSTLPASRGDISRIIYNMRNVSIMEIIGVGSYLEYRISNNDTFLTAFLGIDYITGLLTDNGITSLRGDTVKSNGSIVIDNTVLNVDELNTTRRMIGKYVEAYYTIEGENRENTVEYIQLDERKNNEITEFAISDFVDISNRKIQYYKGNKIKDITLSNFASIIYNGKAEKIVTSDMFDYDYGIVTYVPSNGDNPDVLIIEGYISWLVDAVDREFEFVKGNRSSRKIDNSLQLDIKSSDLNKTLFIEDSYGLTGSLDDILRYSVIDICKNDEVIFIRISPLIASDKQINSIETSQSETTVTFRDGEECKVIPFYSKSDDFKSVKTGGIYYVYRNSFGDIACLVFSEDVSMKYGFLVSAGIEEGIEKQGCIKVLDTDNNFHVYEVDKKIRWSDENNNTSMQKYTDIHSKLLVYGSGIINYKLNEAGKVSVIYLPVSVGNEREMGRLGCVYDGRTGYYESGRKNIGKDVLINSTVSSIPMFKVYLSETDPENRYMSGTAATLRITNSTETNSVNLKAYNYEPHSKYADILVQTHEGAPLTDPTTATAAAVIRKISGTAIYKDEIYTKLTCSTATGEEKILYADVDEITDVPDTMSGTYYTYTLKKGDIILYRPKANDGSVIESMFLWWRSDMDPVDPDRNGRRGFIPGNLGYFDASRSSISNPYIFSGGDGRGDWTAQYRCMAGYVYYVDSKGGFDVTTQDLSYQEYDASLQGWNSDNSGQTPYTQHAVVSHTGRFGLVTYKDGKVYCREGKVDDVKSYVVDGSECSRILFTTTFGRTDIVIVINGEMN